MLWNSKIQKNVTDFGSILNKLLIQETVDTCACAFTWHVPKETLRTWFNIRQTLSRLRLWNTLPLNLRLCDSLGQFKRSLKTFLFELWLVRPRRLVTLALKRAAYEFPYLLTYLLIANIDELKFCSLSDDVSNQQLKRRSVERCCILVIFSWLSSHLGYILRMLYIHISVKSLVWYFCDRLHKISH